MEKDLLERIAQALERIAPPPAALVDLDAPTYHWHAQALHPVLDFAPVALDLLTGIDAQRDAVVENNRRLAAGAAAHDILLWGARGAGKSALVKSSVADLQHKGSPLALVEVSATAFDELPILFAELRGWNRPVIVFLDDLAFEGGDERARVLRSVLEGGATARPANVRLYVTSNRRHILARDSAEQDSAINVRDVIDDRLALADRFGLSLGFHVCDQAVWLGMVAAYAAHFKLTYDTAEALTWATQRGARSGRLAWHYVVELAGRAGKSL
jgi:uncharacterized protein